MENYNRTETQTKILEGMKKVYEKLIVFKKSKNTQLVVIEDGKVVKINP